MSDYTPTPEFKIMPVIATKGELYTMYNKLAKKTVKEAIEYAIKTVNSQKVLKRSITTHTVSKSHLILIIQELDLPPGYKHFLEDHE